MIRHLTANLWLLFLTVVLCCVLYPAILWVVGQVLFPHQAQGSILTDADGKPVGSTLIAQPFADDGYFQPRPSAAGYNASASSASNWGANNPKLRDRVARALGPIVKYRNGPKKGQLVGPDVEAWLQQDRYKGQSGVVAQWANEHNGFAQDWVKADPLNAAYVEAWDGFAGEEQQWEKDHPGEDRPKPEELASLFAVPFFVSYSKDHPGTFPTIVEVKDGKGETVKRVEPSKTGSDIQKIFFDMWLQDHPDADLESVPADMVMASGSGLDPDITLKNAMYQLDRVASTSAERLKRDPEAIRKEIEDVLNQKAGAPLFGLAGVKMVNVLEVNLELKKKYQDKVSSGG